MKGLALVAWQTNNSATQDPSSSAMRGLGSSAMGCVECGRLNLGLHACKQVRLHVLVIGPLRKRCEWADPWCVVFQFETSAPCKLRAKRGFATHPRSIAERNRRSWISDGIKKLQDLFLEIDKQTNTIDMLGLEVEYIKDLQKQVKRLNNKKVKCSCV
ncbi:hypothetical protein UlMin_006951 [Ulmus minor]